ncbi:MAG: hypothetical protein K6F20_02045 [Bacteroidaceae bacterium]|nr:hypothetical protein [Bacteroidaceae bacterium]
MNSVLFGMSKKVLLALALMGLAACSSGNKEEQLASRMLGDARFALRHGHYDEARDSILSMRRQHPTALQARRQAILLLDSIEMAAAADSLKQAEGPEWERLDMKVKFFERKLQEDAKKN